jgi:5-formyltetrahydrofolate cyclo-ligase
VSPNSHEARRALRQQFRDRRRGLSIARRKAAGDAVAQHLLAMAEFKRARTIAVYLAFDGEVPLDAVIRRARSCGKTLVAPRLSRGGRMVFLPLAEAQLRSNSWGIAEPHRGHPAVPRRIDLVLTPLVAFDGQGTRLGMGGGYYDRCFHFLNARAHWLRPKLIGIGYHFQQVPRLVRHPWDVPLWAAVTDHDIWRFSISRKIE